jgi:hypothetical protein
VNDRVPDERQTAAEMARFLFEPRREYGRVEDSPVLTAVKSRLTAMARDLATVLVSSTPSVGELITQQVHAAIAAAMADDAYLREIVTKSVAAAIVERYKFDPAED